MQQLTQQCTDARAVDPGSPAVETLHAERWKAAGPQQQRGVRPALELGSLGARALCELGGWPGQPASQTTEELVH